MIQWLCIMGEVPLNYTNIEQQTIQKIPKYLVHVMYQYLYPCFSIIRSIAVFGEKHLHNQAKIISLYQYTKPGPCQDRFTIQHLHSMNI